MMTSIAINGKRTTNLFQINLTVHPGEVVCLLGRNGAGRTTTLRAILGLVGQRTGSIQVNGQ
ncbi:ATP-binding cassette domain-containing protein, partial [bacterium]|nr:ATP-binding cassette domain-containing protein [bacterium]